MLKGNMKMINKVIILLSFIVFTPGCGTTYTLDEKWHPLTKLANRGDLSNFGLPDTALTTVKNRVYVKDVKEFLKDNPDGSHDFNALLTHERVHSIRQIDHDTLTWISRYVTDRQFMWEEEQAATYVEIIYRKQQGELTNLEDEYTKNYINKKAINLSTMYKNLQGQMIPYEDAKRWLEDVVNDKWKPENNLSNLKGL